MQVVALQKYILIQIIFSSIQEKETSYFIASVEL